MATASVSIRRAVSSSSSALTIGTSRPLGVVGDPDHGQQLLGQQLGAGQREPDATQPEERVRLGGVGR